MRAPAALLTLLLATAAATAPAHAAPPARLEVKADDGHKLVLWRKGDPVKAAAGTFLLLHGRTWSALPDFDLQVAGESLSLMDALAAQGFLVYALDMRGYGATARDRTGWLTPARAAADVAAVLTHVAAQDAGGPRAKSRPVLLGWSLGSMVAERVAQEHPEAISGLVLYGYPYDPDEPRPGNPPAKPERRRNTAKAAAEDFITPGAISEKAVAAYVAAALRADPVRADWRFDDWKLDAAQVKTPTLILQGEHDPYAPSASLAKLWAKLGTADRQWVTLPGGDHAAHLEAPRERFLAAVVAFASRPR